MGLASSLSTALTGLNAAEVQIDVIGNNLANSQTVGFKSSDVVFANQFLQTLSLGAAPTGTNGGTNPRQTGLGVQVAGITPDFSQGTIEISASPSDLAIQGDGFFIVEGSQGERVYSRNGGFSLNSANELVTATGNRLLGFGVDDTFNIQTSELVPLSVPLGSEAVARATSEVVLEGTLSSAGEIATAGEIIQSSILGEGAVPFPPADNIGLATSTTPDITGTTAVSSDGGGSHAEGDIYQYRVVYVDDNGQESPTSNSLTVSVPVGNGTDDNVITLNNLPPANGQFTQLNIYRTEPNGTEFFQLGTAAAGGTFVDDNATPLSTTALDTQNLNGNYSYAVTFFRNGDPESRPSPLVGPLNVVDGRVNLSNLPVPPTPPVGGGFPAYDSIRIYRNLANDPNSFFLVDTVPPGTSYTDNKTDAEISDLNIPGNQAINFDGPTIDSNTLLTNVVRREGLNYTNPFQEGQLTFAGRKGGRQLDSSQFEITATSTVQDLLTFVEDSLGIQTDSGDSVRPINPSENNIPGETGEISPGAFIVNGQIRFVSNNGVDNAVDIDLTSFRVETDSGDVTTPNLGFGSIQEAVGQSAVSDFIAYDTLGLPIRVRVTATLEEQTDSQTVYRWYADSPDNSPLSGNDISIGTGLLFFDGNGNFVSSSNSTAAVQRSGLPSVSPLQFDFNFDSLSGLAADEATLAASRQDGSPPGVLTSFLIGEDGAIRGVFSNGISQDLGQLRLARFSNPSGLEQLGQNLFAQGINTGLPIEGQPGENGLGSVVAGALELSNTDTGQDLVDLVLASTQYRSNTRVITTTQQLFDELLNIRR